MLGKEKRVRKGNSIYKKEEVKKEILSRTERSREMNHDADSSCTAVLADWQEILSDRKRKNKKNRQKYKHRKEKRDARNVWHDLEKESIVCNRTHFSRPSRNGGDVVKYGGLKEPDNELAEKQRMLSTRKVKRSKLKALWQQRHNG